MRYVHLYFVKLFGCLVVEEEIPIDIASFSKALLEGTPHPNLHLVFGHHPKELSMVGRSHVDAGLLEDGRVAFATCTYHVGDLAVDVIYALPGEDCQGLDVAWHPRMGARRLAFAPFGEASS